MAASTLGDLRPEYTQYRDDGCEVHPSCLSCPLPVCIHDTTPQDGRFRNAHLREQVQRVSQLRLQGKCNREIAATLALSRRQVARLANQ